MRLDKETQENYSEMYTKKHQEIHGYVRYSE